MHLAKSSLKKKTSKRGVRGVGGVGVSSQELNHRITVTFFRRMCVRRSMESFDLVCPWEPLLGPPKNRALKKKM